MCQVYDHLEMMKPGTSLRLNARQEKQLPWLLAAVGVFLTSGSHWIDYELNDDFTLIRRKVIPPQTFEFLLKQTVA